MEAIGPLLSEFPKFSELHRNRRGACGYRGESETGWPVGPCGVEGVCPSSGCTIVWHKLQRWYCHPAGMVGEW